MPKVSCRRKGCTRFRTQFSLFPGRKHIPQFEGSSFCSEKCLRMHFESDLRERWGRLVGGRQRQIPRLRLGTILLQTSFITPDQLEEAVSMQTQTQQGRLGEWLLRLGFVEEHQVTLALSKQYGLPLINLRAAAARSDAVRMVPGKVAKSTALLPVGYDDNGESLRIAVSAPINFQAQEAVRRMVGKGIHPYIGDESAIRSLLEQWYGPDELDMSTVPTFCSVEELVEAGQEIIATAIDERADNIQAELLEELFWVRIDLGDQSENFYFRRIGGPDTAGARMYDRQMPLTAADAQ
jgi:MshEN domain